MVSSENDKQVTVNQHYVPRFYMKNFSEIKGMGKKEKALISFYQFDEQLLRGKIPTKSICYKDYFYGEDGEIEKEFANKEKRWAKVIKSIINTDKYNLDKEQEKEVKEFAIFQYSRTLAMYNYSKNMMSEIVHKNIVNRFPNVNEEVIMGLVSEKIEKEVSISDIINICDGLVQEIDDLSISIIKFNTNQKLITSDMPVIRINPFCSDKAGFLMVGVIIFFPISPEIIVMIYDSKIYKNCDKYMIISNEQDVINLNKYQTISAEEMIMSKEIEELTMFYTSESLILKRKENIEKRKVNSSFDGVGTFFASKSRFVSYDFELSFCKLPKCLKKIPIECREAFKRKYDYKARIALLVRVYKFPKIVSQDIDEIDSSKMKSGYSKLLKFMDDYWDVPSKDRVITPELMKRLKEVPVRFFALDGK